MASISPLLLYGQLNHLPVRTVNDSKNIYYHQNIATPKPNTLTIAKYAVSNKGHASFLRT